MSLVGKPGGECEGPVRYDTSAGGMDSDTGALDSLRAATSGSAGVDVETAVDKTLVTTEVVCIDTNVKGPLGHGLSALLLGRSSTSKQGIFVLPGVIDADFTGVVKVMVYTLAPPLSIPASSRIAQLVPFRACVPHAHHTTVEMRALGPQDNHMYIWH